MGLLEFQATHCFAGGFELDAAFESDQLFTALFGPSGSGKTTILNIIAGMFRPQHAVVRLSECDLVNTESGVCLPPDQRRIGFVFQDGLLFPHLSVEGNLRYGMTGGSRHPRRFEFRRVVEVLEIGPLLARMPRALSGGEKQRVALGRALLSSPQLLVMDEPLAALDESLKSRVLDYLQRAVAEWQAPVLYVTHSQAEVRRAAARVIVINRGRIVACGTPDEALTQSVPLAWTNSAGPVNLLRIDRIVPDGRNWIAHVGDKAILVPAIHVDASRPAFIQFRPADVMLSREDVSGVSARNHLRGRVCRILTLEQAVFVAVDIGQVLWAEITDQALCELQLAVGSEVTCLLKSHSLSVV